MCERSCTAAEWTDGMDLMDLWPSGLTIRQAAKDVIDGAAPTMITTSMVAELRELLESEWRHNDEFAPHEAMRAELVGMGLDPDRPPQD